MINGRIENKSHRRHNVLSITRQEKGNVYQEYRKLGLFLVPRHAFWENELSISYLNLRLLKILFPTVF